MIEPWLLMNWHRTMDWLLLAPTLSAQEALDWGLLNKVVPRGDLGATVEEMARRIGQIPLTTLMAVKSNVKRAYELGLKPSDFVAQDSPETPTDQQP